MLTLIISYKPVSPPIASSVVFDRRLSDRQTPASSGQLPCTSISISSFSSVSPFLNSSPLSVSFDWWNHWLTRSCVADCRSGLGFGFRSWSERFAAVICSSLLCRRLSSFSQVFILSTVWSWAKLYSSYPCDVISVPFVSITVMPLFGCSVPLYALLRLGELNIWRKNHY